jgi:hypothetical protein
MGIDDFITGEKFIEVADFVYAPKDKVDDYNPIVNTFCHCTLKEVNVVYTHTKYVKDLFKQISGLKCKFVIITHNCDENIDFLPPKNVIKWFTQNVAIKSSRIESIPIGLENDRWFKLLQKKEKMIAILHTSKNYKNLVYMNHNVNTNPFERVPIYDLLQDKPWVTVEKGVNGKRFDEYLDNIYNHKYIICPQGNGVDTHRLWETLYMGSIPIVKKDTNNWFYNDLPLLYVHKWEEVDKELLEDMWDTYHFGEWNREMLTFEYWKNKIINASKFKTTDLGNE